MVNNLPNAVDANKIVDIFKPLFNFSKYKESYYDFKDLRHTTYKAETDDRWSINITTYSYVVANNGMRSLRLNLHFRKDDAIFRYSDESDIEEIKQKSKVIADYVDNLYQPDYKTILDILEIFIKEGVDSGMVNSAETKAYNKKAHHHINIQKNTGEIRISFYNLSTISFNNLLQKVQGKKKTHFKKSYVSVYIVYLIDSNNEVKPYFKIMLPYSSTTKKVYVVPINNAKKVFFVGDEDRLKTKHVDEMESISITDGGLKLHFQQEFKKEIIKAISKALKIKQENLNNLLDEALKDYFVLVEMMKI